MQCKELEAVLEAEDLNALSAEAREHLAACTGCQDLLADLSAIVVAAKRLPAEITPPDRVWISIHAQLEAEGIIRDTESVAAARSPWWQGFAEFFRPRVLATVAAGLLVVTGSIYVLEHRQPNEVAQNPPPIHKETQTSQIPPPVVSSTPSDRKPVAPNAAPEPTARPRPVIVARNPGARASTLELKASPSEDDLYFGNSASVLDDDENSLPRRGVSDNAAVDAALRKNLRTLNEFIAECKSRLKQNPQDQLTREYLNMAYQQKAELLTAMLDSGRSEH